MLITTAELLDLVIMTVALGYIFMGLFKRPSRVKAEYDPLKATPRGFDMEAFKFSCLIVAPGIILHELGHKFVAMALGLGAVFHASFGGLMLGVILKVMNTGFIIFVPGYVSISGAEPMQMAITAFAGPFMNLMLFIIPTIILAYAKNLRPRTKVILVFTKRINLFLFIFNMIPFGFFDGAKVVNGLMAAFG